MLACITEAVPSVCKVEGVTGVAGVAGVDGVTGAGVDGSLATGGGTGVGGLSDVRPAA